jgi:hypothetical protein
MIFIPLSIGWRTTHTKTEILLYSILDKETPILDQSNETWNKKFRQGRKPDLCYRFGSSSPYSSQPTLTESSTHANWNAIILPIPEIQWRARTAIKGWPGSRSLSIYSVISSSWNRQKVEIISWTSDMTADYRATRRCTIWIKISTNSPLTESPLL